MKTTVKKKVLREDLYGGLEKTLDVIAWVLLVYGLAQFLFVSIKFGREGLIGSLGSLVGVVAAWAVLRALGEMIRLQKKAAGMRFSGKISEVS